MTIGTLIGMSGYAGSGKDTAAQVLIDEYGFTRIAFADVLREMALAIDPYVYLGSVPDDAGIRFIGEYRRLYDVINMYGWDIAKNYFEDVRRLLQRLGTEAGRQILGENIWVDTALRRAEGDVVVTDVRFPNELQAIYEQDGIVIRVERPGVGPRNDHPSETALTNAEFTTVIQNDGTIADLHQTMRLLMKEYE